MAASQPFHHLEGHSRASPLSDPVKDPPPFPEGLPSDPREVFRRTYVRCCFWAALLHVGFLLGFAFAGVPPMALFNLASIAVWLGGAILLHRDRMAAGMALTVGELALHAVAAVATVGWAAGFQYYLLFFPLIFFLGPLAGRLSVWFGGVILPALLLGCLELLSLVRDPGYILDPQVLTFFRTGNLLAALGLMTLIALIYARVTRIAQERVRSLTEELHHQASTDPMTGLANRRALEERLEAERARAQRTGRGFTLLMVDLDHFKAVNDRYGHPVGDQVLKELADLLRRELRSIDLLGRWGGEEFLVLLPETRFEGGHRVAEKIRRRIEQTEFEGGGHRIGLTLTIGLASCGPNEALRWCLKRADDALLQGKDSNRNQVVPSMNADGPG